MTKARNIADIGSNDVLDTDANGVDVTGSITADGLTVDGTATITNTASTNTLTLTGNTGSVAGLRLAAEENHAVILGVNEGNNFGGVKVQTNSNGTLVDRFNVASNGDITMYKADGSTAGMTFDASAGDITVAGAVKSSKLTSSRDASAVFVDFVDTGVANDSEGDVVIQGYYPIKFKTDLANERMRIHRNGDITFFKYNSADSGFFYDSSTQNVTLTDGDVFLDYGNLDMRRDSHVSGDKRSTFWLNGSGGYPGNNYFQLGTYGGGLGAIERIRVYGNNNANTGDVIRITSGDDVVINENGYAETDFRVESDTNANMLFVDGGSNRVGVGTNNPIEVLNVNFTDTSTHNTSVTKGTNTPGIWVTNTSNANNAAGIHFSTGGASHFSSIVGARTANASHWGTHLAFYTHPNNTANIDVGTEKMRIDGDGRITTPYQPSFHAVREAGHVYGNSNRITVVFNSVVHNIGNHYNSSTGVFTAPVAGRYLFMANGMSTYNQAGDKQLAIHINGSAKNISNPASTSTGGARPFATYLIADLSANDTAYVSFYSNSGSDYLYGSGGYWNGFNGYLIG